MVFPLWGRKVKVDFPPYIGRITQLEDWGPFGYLVELDETEMGFTDKVKFLAERKRC